MSKAKKRREIICSLIHKNADPSKYKLVFESNEFVAKLKEKNNA